VPSRCDRSLLFDYLVSAREEGFGDRQPKRPSPS
jgi:hypothetical protein